MQNSDTGKNSGDVLPRVAEVSDSFTTGDSAFGFVTFLRLGFGFGRRITIAGRRIRATVGGRGTLAAVSTSESESDSELEDSDSELEEDESLSLDDATSAFFLLPRAGFALAASESDDESESEDDSDDDSEDDSDEDEATTFCFLVLGASSSELELEESEEESEEESLSELALRFRGWTWQPLWRMAWAWPVRRSRRYWIRSLREELEDEGVVRLGVHSILHIDVCALVVALALGGGARLIAAAALIVALAAAVALLAAADLGNLLHGRLNARGLAIVKRGLPCLEHSHERMMVVAGGLLRFGFLPALDGSVLGKFAVSIGEVVLGEEVLNKIHQLVRRRRSRLLRARRGCGLGDLGAGPFGLCLRFLVRFRHGGLVGELRAWILAVG